MAIDKKDAFLKLRKDADRKRLFCSNVSTLLSMIVGVAKCMTTINKHLTFLTFVMIL